MKKIITIIFCSVFSLICLAQNTIDIGKYKVHSHGKDMSIILCSNGTYKFETFWGQYHGLYEIIANNSDSTYDEIYFYDDIFNTKDAFFYFHTTLPPETISSIAINNPILKDSSFVAMYDITGDIIPYHSVCFSDSSGNVFSCHYNPDKKHTIHIIPSNTRWISIIGEKGNLTTYFKSNYEESEGSIAYIIGPSPGRFRIKKDKSCILYRSCYCNNNNPECCVVFQGEGTGCNIVPKKNERQKSANACPDKRK